MNLWLATADEDEVCLMYRMGSSSTMEALAEAVQGVVVETIDETCSVQFRPFGGSFSLDEQTTSGWGALKISSAGDDQLMVEIVLNDFEHEGIIGQLISGHDHLKAVASIELDDNSSPTVPICITRCTLNDDDIVGEEASPDDDLPPNPILDERHKRLFNIRMKLNQARSLNKKQTQDEQERMTETLSQRKKRALIQQRKMQKEEKNNQPTDPQTKEAQLLNETAESADQKQLRLSRKKPAAFGWDVFNQDSLYRAYKKRTKHIPVGIDDSSAKGDSALDYGLAPLPPKAAVDCMVSELASTASRRARFSRRRQFYEDETVSYINERNRVFNKKVSRFMDPYTQQLRADIEKGTG